MVTALTLSGYRTRLIDLLSPLSSNYICVQVSVFLTVGGAEDFGKNSSFT